MKSYTLLIASMDLYLIDELKYHLHKHPELKIIGTVCDGIKALQAISEKHPDLILMDMLLTGLDGLCLLKEIHKLPSPPLTICLSDFDSPACIGAARSNGASYFICRPMEISSIISILHEHVSAIQIAEEYSLSCREANGYSAISSEVHHILHSLGFSPKLTGSEYLAESVIIAHDSPLMVRNLSSEIYSEIAHRRNTTPACIERSIRSAIAAADISGRLTSILGMPPTNKRCIRYILDQIISTEVVSRVL